MDQLRYVLECLRWGNYRVTLHAQRRMVERNISRSDIRSCGETGKALSESDGKIKVTGIDRCHEILSLICVEENGILIITVF